MEKLPASYKKLLFNKEAHEPLTVPEQEAWEALLSWEQRLDIEADIDDPEFITAMKLHYALEVRKNAVFEKIKNAVLQGEETDEEVDEEIEEPKPQKDEEKKFRIPRWIGKAAAAAVILVVSGTVLYLYINKASATPNYLIQGSGYNELCSVTLPDGSQVQLNALSYLRYPEKFANDERYVKLTGEAFFNVKSDKKHPFRVSASGNDVVATGTEFNVKAYEEEGTVTATLKLGKLQVKTRSGSEIINEGEQAVIKDGNIRIIKKVNMDFVLAWQQKLILLEDESLLSIMRQIKRCYTKNFRIEGNPPAMPGLEGTVSTTVNSLPGVLHTIEYLVPKIKFEFAYDSTIIVTENRK